MYLVNCILKTISFEMTILYIIGRIKDTIDEHDSSELEPY